MTQHYENRGNPKTFAGRYYCYNPIYYERHESPSDAIDREKELKKWSRAKKLKLMQATNPTLQFFNIKELENLWRHPEYFLGHPEHKESNKEYQSSLRGIFSPR